MALVVHLGLLGVAIAALGGASLRCSSRLCLAADGRILGAAALAAGFAITEPLLLGLTGHGANPYLLTGAALVTWLVARLLVAAPEITLRHQAAAAWATASSTVRACAGALVALVIGTTIHQLRHPQIGYDGVVYHVAQPAVWIGNGHPGSFHQTVHAFPTQAYPKSFEVLVFWVSAISRTFATLVPLMMVFYVLAAYATFVALRRVGCNRALATLTTGTAMVVPWNVFEFGSAYNDVATYAFLVTAVALCLVAQAEPVALGLAVLAGGVSIGIKTTAAPLVVIAAGWAAYRLRAQLRRYSVSLGSLGGFGLALAALWYALNLVKYHAPFWPFSRFPDGPPQPYLWRTLGATFLQYPVATVKALDWRIYREFLAGELVLLGAIFVVVPMAFLRSQREIRRVLLVGCAVAAGYVLAWSDTQFTGLSHSIPLLAYSTLRYLTAAPVLVACLLAVIARRPGPPQRVAVAILVAALAFNLFEDRHLTSGLIPSLPACIALALIGILAGLLSRHTAAVSAIIRQPWLMPALAISGVMLTTPLASSYLEYYVVAAASPVRNEIAILNYLRSQPAWVNGHAPVAAGDEAAATFAGPTFNHPLSYVGRREPCREIRASASHGWLIMWAKSGGQFKGLGYTLRRRCLKGVTPVAMPGPYSRVYAAPGLVTSATQ
jgi:hypothetical protein